MNYVILLIINTVITIITSVFACHVYYKIINASVIEKINNVFFGIANDTKDILSQMIIDTEKALNKTISRYNNKKRRIMGLLTK